MNDLKLPVRVGIDIADCRRLLDMFSQHNAGTLAYLFSPAEYESCLNRGYQFLAISFSAKEAVGKALGTGLANLNWYDIQIFPQNGSELRIVLLADVKSSAEKLLISKWHGFWQTLSESLCITTVIAYN